MEGMLKRAVRPTNFIWLAFAFYAGSQHTLYGTIMCVIAVVGLFANVARDAY